MTRKFKRLRIGKKKIKTSQNCKSSTLRIFTIVTIFLCNIRSRKNLFKISKSKSLNFKRFFTWRIYSKGKPTSTHFLLPLLLLLLLLLCSFNFSLYYNKKQIFSFCNARSFTSHCRNDLFYHSKSQFLCFISTKNYQSKLGIQLNNNTVFWNVVFSSCKYIFLQPTREQTKIQHNTLLEHRKTTVKWI